MPEFEPSYSDTPGDFWTRRLQRGRAGRIFQTPEELLTVAKEYFDWCHANPLQEQKAFAYKGEVEVIALDKMRVFTLGGFCTFAGFSIETYRSYRTVEGYKDATEVIDTIIYTQKFEGAAANLLNPMLISRDLGLADKSELSGPGGGPIEVEGTARDAADFTRKLSSLAAARGAAIAPGGANGGSEGAA